jgi:acetate---CoA ligase (ADP-forming)
MVVQCVQGSGFGAPAAAGPAVFGRLTWPDGTTAQVRLATPMDRDSLRSFFEGLSPESRRRRFFSASLPRPELIASLCENRDPHSGLTLLVIRGHKGQFQIIATASYVAKDKQTAEVAFAVDDAFQHQGLGTLLLHRLASLAVPNGFIRFWAVTQADNQMMRDVFRESGFAWEERAQGNEIEVYLSLLQGPIPASRTSSV